MASLRRFILRSRCWHDLGSFLLGERDRRLRKARRRGGVGGARAAAYGRVVRVRPRGLTTPVHARLGTSDFMVIEDLLVHGAGDGRGEYDAAMDAAAKACGGAERVGCVLDLGANIGIAAAMFAERFPRATVVAVEPEAANFGLLETNTRGFGRVRCLRACVGATKRTVTLDRSAHGGEPWAVAMKDGEGDDRVEVVTVDEVRAAVEGERGSNPPPAPPSGRGGWIDLLKCDIEGAEREVFASCAAWIGRVRVIAVELHAPYREAEFLDRVRRGCGGSMPFAVTTLRQDAAIQVLLLERTAAMEAIA